MEDKLTGLKRHLSAFKSVVIAFSGGVDSTFLARIAKDVYGENLLLVTATSSTYPSYELAEAGFTKTDIRHFSEKLQLPTARKQSYACLASRFPYGEKITNKKLIDLVEAVARRKEATPAQIALAWLLAQKKWIVPIPGTTKLHRLEENIGSVDVELSDEDLKEIESAASKITIQGQRYSESNQKMIDD